MWVGTDTGRIYVYGSNCLLLHSWVAASCSIVSIISVSDNVIWTASKEGEIGFWLFKDRQIEPLRKVVLGKNIHSLIYTPRLKSMWCILDNGLVTIWDSEVSF